MNKEYIAVPILVRHKSDLEEIRIVVRFEAGDRREVLDVPHGSEKRYKQHKNWLNLKILR